jgi:hypothetical protein
MKACVRESNEREDFVCLAVAMEAAFFFYHEDKKLNGVQDFVYSHLLGNDAWQNIRFWERAFYGPFGREQMVLVFANRVMCR